MKRCIKELLTKSISQFSPCLQLFCWNRIWLIKDFAIKCRPNVFHKQETKIVKFNFSLMIFVLGEEVEKNREGISEARTQHSTITGIETFLVT